MMVTQLYSMVLAVPNVTVLMRSVQWLNRGGEPSPPDTAFVVTDGNGRDAPGMYGGFYSDMPQGQCYSSPSKPSVAITFSENSQKRNIGNPTDNTNLSDERATLHKRFVWSYRSGNRYIYEGATTFIYTPSNYAIYQIDQYMTQGLFNAFYNTVVAVLRSGQEHVYVLNQEGVRVGQIAWVQGTNTLAQMNPITLREMARDALNDMIARGLGDVEWDVVENNEVMGTFQITRQTGN
jgi:hypothetical protein